MDKNFSSLIGPLFIILLTASFYIINELFLPTKNTTKIYLYLTATDILASIIVIVLFRPFLLNIIFFIPKRLEKIKKILLKFLEFLISPSVKIALYLIVLAATIFSDNLSIKIINGLFLFFAYYMVMNKKDGVLPWTQNREPKFQDNFNKDLKLWNTVSGAPEIESNFGDPAPDVLLKNVGKPSGETQTFITVKDLEIKEKAVIECEVYIEPGGVVNLIFGANDQSSKYYMVRVDTRETEYDALLYKPDNAGWNFVFRSDRYRGIAKQWHRLKLEILSGNDIKFYKDGELIISRRLEHSAYGNIGIFNELADVHLDNFVVS